MIRQRLGLASAVLILALAGCQADLPSNAPTIAPTPSAEPTPAPPGLTITEAIALRDGGELGSEQITLNGYWTNRFVGHSCAIPPQPQGEIDVWCHDGEYGFTERNEAIVLITNDGRMFPAEGPHLTPWMPENITRVLMGGMMQLEVPPVPIVVEGHFNDPRAAGCHETRRQNCRGRFVIDEIVAFDPLSVPPATPTPPPTPFPNPPPLALFGPNMCRGDDEYAFIGWTTTDQLGTRFDRPGHVFAMVTKDPVPITDWIGDPSGSRQRFRWWAQRICLSEDVYIGQPFNSVPITFDTITGSGFREWEDGRREPGDPP